MRMMSSIGPSIGADRGSAVSGRYSAPYAHTGTLQDVVGQASPDRYGDAAVATARAEMSRPTAPTRQEHPRCAPG